jgi:hypothetical protein
MKDSPDCAHEHADTKRERDGAERRLALEPQQHDERKREGTRRERGKANPLERAPRDPAPVGAAHEPLELVAPLAHSWLRVKSYRC